MNWRLTLIMFLAFSSCDRCGSREWKMLSSCFESVQPNKITRCTCRTIFLHQIFTTFYTNIERNWKTILKQHRDYCFKISHLDESCVGLRPILPLRWTSAATNSFCSTNTVFWTEWTRISLFHTRAAPVILVSCHYTN